MLDIRKYSHIVFDCDGVITELDCDDRNAKVGAESADGDCDGIITELDCDDTSADALPVPFDSDCDGFQPYTWPSGFARWSYVRIRGRCRLYWSRFVSVSTSDRTHPTLNAGSCGVYSRV